jgi:hypothetical protein
MFSYTETQLTCTKTQLNLEVIVQSPPWER